MAEKIGIDSVIFIYLLENNPKYFSKAEKLLRSVQNKDFEAVFSVIGLIEILTGPKSLGDYQLALQYKELITDFPNLIIAGINENIVDIASDLRAKYNIKTPDAIHIATAIDFQASVFYTNDSLLKRVKEIEVKTM